MPAPDRSRAMEHIVVALFENRSLDNVLGHLYGPEDGKTFDGVIGKDLSNPIPAWAEHGADRQVVPYTVATDMDSPNPDSGEEYYHTNTQLYGVLDEPNRFKLGEAVTAPWNAPPPGAMPTMDGFVADYISTFTGEMGRQPTYEEYAHIMTGCTPEQLPVLNGIARDFGVFDHWYCEVPSQTFMNRSFWTAATSSGFVVNSPMSKWFAKNDAETIFDRLEARGRTRQVQKMHVARLKFPGPATEETWVTDAAGDPVFMVIAEPSQSLAGQLRGLLPQLRQVAGEGRRVTVCFDRGGWSPALFADITGAGFDLLTYRKGPVADLPGPAFTTFTCTDDRGRSHEYELADTIVELEIGEGPRKGEHVTLRQVTRREPASRGAIRQVHTLTSRTDLPAGEVCWRMSSRWREENYFRYARTHFALDALDSYAAAPDDPDRLVPSPAKKAAAARVLRAEAAIGAAEAGRDASLLELRSPAPATPRS